MSVVIQLPTNLFIFLHDYSHSEYIYNIYILYNPDGLYSNRLVDTGALVNVMPISVWKRINGQPKPSTWRVVQLDRTNVKLIGEMEDVLIRLSSNEKVCQFIDIVVVGIYFRVVCLELVDGS